LRDVAAAAGVSIKTASRVVNGEPLVSPELVARVNEAVEALGYRPDQRARLLRSAGSRPVTIGFVLVDVANPFFSTILRGIEEVATHRDCLVLAGSTEGSAERQHQLVEAFVERRVDGLIVVDSSPDGGPIGSEIRRGTPVVFIDLEPGLEAVDLVRSDHYAGARSATEHLLGHGHTDIAYLGDDPRIFSARQRLAGFSDAVASAGIDVAPRRILTGSRTEDEWHEAALTYFGTRPRPTAVLSAQNYVTLGTVRALHDLGLHRSVAQVGFDDVELADVVDPGITVLPQRPRILGRRAAEILFARIGGDRGPARREIIRSPLIVRGSGEIRPPAQGA
jgi:LacI family transcriptional regulator